MEKLEVTKQTDLSSLMGKDINCLKDYVKENLSEDLHEKFNEICGTYVVESGLIQEFIATFILNFFVFEYDFKASVGLSLMEWDL